MESVDARASKYPPLSRGKRRDIECTNAERLHFAGHGISEIPDTASLSIDVPSPPSPSLHPSPRRWFRSLGGYADEILVRKTLARRTRFSLARRKKSVDSTVRVSPNKSGQEAETITDSFRTPDAPGLSDRPSVKRSCEWLNSSASDLARYEGAREIRGNNEIAAISYAARFIAGASCVVRRALLYYWQRHRSMLAIERSPDRMSV